MDTSKEYIEMCRKASEIQELWVVHSDGCDITIDWPSGELTGRKEVSVVWLPRQDQLQDMIKENSFAYHLLGDFADWVFKNSKYFSFMLLNTFSSYSTRSILLIRTTTCPMPSIETRNP